MRHGEYRYDLLLDAFDDPRSDPDEIEIARGLSMSIGNWRKLYPCECEAICECFDEDGNYVGAPE